MLPKLERTCLSTKDPMLRRIMYDRYSHKILFYGLGEVRRIRVFSDDMALITLKPGALYKVRFF